MKGNLFEISLENRISELMKLKEFLDDTGGQLGLANDILFKVNLVLEEIFTNIVNYAYDDHRLHQINIQVTKKDRSLSIRVEDDGKPFNMLDYPEPDINLPAGDREIGGMGLHFVRTLMDSITYESTGKNNVLVLVKHLEQ